DPDDAGDRAGDVQLGAPPFSHTERDPMKPPRHLDPGVAPAIGRQTSRLRVAVVLALCVGGAFGLGMLRRRSDAAVRKPDAKLHVEVIPPKPIQSGVALDLPGTIKPLEQTSILPRANGYVRRWLVDIGDKVTAGQVLAEIDVPELDAQLAQARAQLEQANAAL